jgi:hypothetical protein
MEDLTRIFQATHRATISGCFFKFNSSAERNEFADSFGLRGRDVIERGDRQICNRTVGADTGHTKTKLHCNYALYYNKCLHQRD